ncbi:hypothetical protein GGR56DRAFT_639282 [Xylariaceae sp. FL0804]|nr:hypothetical protein GGR56DRAFT_639282 [Xylariaceae sp. FL0804]
MWPALVRTESAWAFATVPQVCAHHHETARPGGTRTRLSPRLAVQCSQRPCLQRDIKGQYRRLKNNGKPQVRLGKLSWVDEKLIHPALGRETGGRPIIVAASQPLPLRRRALRGGPRPRRRPGVPARSPRSPPTNFTGHVLHDPPSAWAGVVDARLARPRLLWVSCASAHASVGIPITPRTTKPPGHRSRGRRNRIFCPLPRMCRR